MFDAFDLLNFSLMLLAMFAPLFIVYKVRNTNRRYLGLAILLAAFTFSHSLYHLSLYLGMDYVAAILFWPLGAIMLLAFGLYYWKVGA